MCMCVRARACDDKGHLIRIGVSLSLALSLSSLSLSLSFSLSLSLFLCTLSLSVCVCPCVCDQRGVLHRWPHQRRAREQPLPRPRHTRPGRQLRIQGGREAFGGSRHPAAHARTHTHMHVWIHAYIHSCKNLDIDR